MGFSNYNRNPLPSWERRITRSLSTLKQYIMHEDNAKSSKPHGSNIRGKLISLTIIRRLPTAAFRFDLQLPCNSTVGHLRHEIARSLPGAMPKQIFLQSDGQVLEDDSCTLKSVPLMCGQELLITKLDKT